jgi:hypothetical protein
MEFTGFLQDKDDKVIEYLPHNEQMKSLDQRRALFFNMYNFYMEKDLRFTKDEYLGKSNILTVFKKKIEELLKPCYFTQRSRAFKIDIASTKIIHAYQKGSAITVLQNPKLKVAKLINLIYRQGSYSLLLDIDDMFLNLVYERIKKVNRESKVVLGDKEIIIYDKNPDASPTLVIPFYKSIQKSNMREDSTVNKNINLAMKHLKEEKILQIFLVFPKSIGFSKHIDLKFHNDIKLKDDQYRVKMIPYSFSFCIRNQTKKRRIA